MNFPGFLGNSALKSRLSSGPLTHAYLITGAEGTGRHTLARIIAAAKLCTGAGEKPCGICPHCRKIFRNVHPDVISVDLREGRKTIAVEDIRDMAADAYVTPNEADGKVYIISNAGAITRNGQNAALKIIEEPPMGVSFIFIAEHAGEMLPTVLSRCTELSVLPAPVNELADLIKQRMPDKSTDEIIGALNRSESSVTAAQQLLSGERSDVSGDTKLLISALKTGNNLRAIEYAAVFEKAERDRLEALLTDARVEVLELLKKAELDPQMNKLRIYNVLKVIDRATDALKYNVSAGHIGGMLMAELCKEK